MCAQWRDMPIVSVGRHRHRCSMAGEAQNPRYCGWRSRTSTPPVASRRAVARARPPRSVRNAVCLLTSIPQIGSLACPALASLRDCGARDSPIPERTSPGSTWNSRRHPVEQKKYNSPLYAMLPAAAASLIFMPQTASTCSTALMGSRNRATVAVSTAPRAGPRRRRSGRRATGLRLPLSMGPRQTQPHQAHHKQTTLTNGHGSHAGTVARARVASDRHLYVQPVRCHARREASRLHRRTDTHQPE